MSEKKLLARYVQTQCNVVKYGSTRMKSEQRTKKYVNRKIVLYVRALQKLFVVDKKKK